MQVRLKLFASLAQYLPPGAVDNEIGLEVAAGTTVRALLDAHRVPPEACHLVLVNGIFLPLARRAQLALTEGDAVAVWPPVAGG